MIYQRLLNFFLIFMMLFICLNLTREHWQNFFNYEIEKQNFYEKFHINLDGSISKIDSSELLHKRSFEDIPGGELEQREKSRWVFLKMLNIPQKFIKDYSEAQKFYPKEKVSLYLYSIFLGIIFFSIFCILYFLINTLNSLNKSYFSDNRVFKRENFLIYLFFSYFIVITYLNLSHFRGGEDNFSIFETLFLVFGIYLVIVNDYRKNQFYIWIYFIICLYAPLIRESGIIISGFYLIYNFMKYKKITVIGILIPFFSLFPYCIANFDILKFYLHDGFILSTKSMESQTTWHDLGNNLIGTLHALFYNFIIFFIPIIVFFRRKNALQNIFLFFIILYFILLSFASVLDHVSTRFMPSCLIIIFSYIGIYDINFENRTSLKKSKS